MAPELHRGVSSFSFITGMNCAKGLLGGVPPQPSSQVSFGLRDQASPPGHRGLWAGSWRPALGPRLVGPASWYQTAQEGSKWERAV